jgi:hypothetical protein
MAAEFIATVVIGDGHAGASGSDRGAMAGARPSAKVTPCRLGGSNCCSRFRDLLHGDVSTWCGDDDRRTAYALGVLTGERHRHRHGGAAAEPNDSHPDSGSYCGWRGHRRGFALAVRGMRYDQQAEADDLHPVQGDHV